MSSGRLELLRKTAQRGKYAPLFRHLAQLPGQEWQATFGQIENVLGFRLPDSARVHRPWWANQGERGGHSHALAWEIAGWKTSQVDMTGEKLVFVRDYAQDELNSLWQRLLAKGSNFDVNDLESRQPLANLPAIILKNTETEQKMMFRISVRVASYADFDPPSDYHPIIVTYARIRENNNESWGVWVGEPLESSTEAVCSR